MTHNCRSSQVPRLAEVGRRRTTLTDCPASWTDAAASTDVTSPTSDSVNRDAAPVWWWPTRQPPAITTPGAGRRLMDTPDITLGPSGVTCPSCPVASCASINVNLHPLRHHLYSRQQTPFYSRVSVIRFSIAVSSHNRQLLLPSKLTFNFHQRHNKL